MSFNNSIERADILFIGSGISTSFTLLSFLENISKAKVSKSFIITVLDKWDEFNKGLPYGQRSGSSVLLITSLRNFLPEPELTPFINWLNINKQRLIKEFKKSGGQLSKNWLEKHHAEIEHNQWEELFIPRFFFGHYIDEKVTNRIEEVKKTHTIHVNFTKGKAADLLKNNGCWTVVLKDGTSLETEKVVLSIGSLPMKFLYKEKRVVHEKNLLFINDIYTNSLNKSLIEIREYLGERKELKANVAIIGANASALEMLYKLNDDSQIAAQIDKYIFVSTYGVLPDSEISEEKQKMFRPANLQALERKAKLRASDISEAAFKDLKIAENLDLGAFSTVNIISDAFGKLLGKLSDQELRNFACYYGNEIGRFQRVAGLHYTNTVKILKESDSFEHIAGKFTGVIQNGEGNNILEYLDTGTKELETLNDPVHIVINCTGSMNLSSPKVPKLIRNIIKKEFVHPNESNIGFDVNDYLAADKNLHIMGPMLAGNVIDQKPIWHVEHCGRIIWLSGVLGKILSNFYCFEDKLNRLELKVRDLNKSEDREIYAKHLKEYWSSNPYRSLPYLSHHLNDNDRLIAFELLNDEKVLALMPMVLREVPIKVNNEDYFDVISPYGYSGPLFIEDIDEIFIYAFWNLVDQWYFQNKIVTEFIRFSLNGNHKYYSGRLELTLKNVVGSIHADWQENWNGFLSKVRNNYRKALDYNLKFEIYWGKDIGENEIRDFHDIYIETMDRNRASSGYFYKLDFFKNLIYSLPDKFVLAFSKKDEDKASTELLIFHENRLYAFLGGTRQEFFPCRPNDYLRVEIVKWASSNGIDKYVLGGGRQDEDGLYKHKKSLFPRDQDVMYYTGRKIVLEDINRKLNTIQLNDVQVEYETVDNDYFPKYRFW